MHFWWYGMVYIEALKEESQGVEDEEKEKVAWLVITLLQNVGAVHWSLFIRSMNSLLPH
jgi:hypothetical protein